MARAKVTAANYVPSLIRTYVPVLIGAVLGWLAVKGFHLDPHAQAGVTAVVTTLITAAYYAGVRVLEIKFPALGILLGHKAQPVYVKPTTGGGSQPVGPGPVVGPPAPAASPFHRA